MYMNNPINYCLQRIKNEIPKEILNIAVVEDNSIFNNNITIDEKIITKAIAIAIPSPPTIYPKEKDNTNY